MKHLTICCAIGLFAGGVALADEAFFTGLGDLPGGPFASRGLGISADGSTVVGQSAYEKITHWPYQAFRWTRQMGMVGLGGSTPALAIEAYGASGDGSVVVGGGTGGAFRWTQQQGLTMLGDLQGGAVPARSGAYAVSPDGQVIVGYAKGGGIQAFRRTEDAGMVGLGYLAGGWQESQAWGVSANGSVIAGVSDSARFRYEAFRWENGNMVGLGVLPGATESWARAVSADGSVIAGDSNPRAFRWTEATGMIDLGPGIARGISADGSIIVGDSGGGAAFWDAAGNRHSLQHVLVNQYNLNLTGWELWSARSVSADGRTFVGFGIGPKGPEGWIAHIPEPATLPLLALGLTLTARRREA